MAEFVAHEACPGCGSSDAFARYDDGSGHCFTKCGYNEKANGEHTTTETATTTKDWTPVTGHYEALPHRGLREETLKKWGYQLGEFNGRPAHIMNVRDDNGTLIAQKFRTEGSKGQWIGEAKSPPLYGQWLWGKGKHIVITEGELDAMSVSQAMDLKWPVVSLPNGTGSIGAIARAYEYLDRFERIVLMFDMDKPGRDAIEEAAALLPIGKVAIANLTEKDANEVLIKHGPAQIVQAFWDAKPWRPDGIIDGAEFTLEKVKQAANVGFSISLPKLQEMVLGIRKAELTLLTAGSGIGKSTWARELAYELHEKHGCHIGNVYLEEQNVKTVQGYVAIDQGVPLGRLRQDPTILTDEQWQSSLTRVVNKGMYFYDHFGSLAADNLISKLRFLAKVCKVDFTVLDHISIVTSGIESGSEGERKDIDVLMTRLQSLTQETGMGIIAIVHLKRSQGKTFNEGSQISLSDLRGSASLEQLSDNVYALERDQQSEDRRDFSVVRVLKCRETGDTGEADTLQYERKTGRLILASPFEPASDFAMAGDKPGEPLTF